ncbi:MAG: ammonia-forming cytochrome c nitrite reductase subunit c552 [Planctomycetaceae bacterium]
MAVVTFGLVGLLVTIFEHRQEARTPYTRVVEVSEVSTDPEPWGLNWPYQYESYRRTVDTTETEYGGSSAMPESKLEQSPWLRRLYAGYAFSLDYREARGHGYMLYDQQATERVTKRPQSGGCLHCHASVIPTYRRIGLEAEGGEVTPQRLAENFDLPAVMAGFRAVGARPYAEVLAELQKTPDRYPVTKAGEAEPSPTAPASNAHLGDGHPVSCVDCHEPATMRIRVTRPGFLLGIAALAESDDPVPHLPSIAAWRQSKRDRAYDPNLDASRQEMRSFVCGQCHVEYYCGNKMTLTYPWSEGLSSDAMERFWDQATFDDGSEFVDYKHGETGAALYKAQHPEFELWSQGIHARSGVSCADCHMPYERQGAMKVSSHWVRSPMLSINRSCQTCHNIPEEELVARVQTIQGRTLSLLDRAAAAMTDMLDAIGQAQASGASDSTLQPILDLQRKAMWRLDFVSSENSKGFHADQEAARILAESIDYSRQAQAAANAIRGRSTSEEPRDTQPVQGVTPKGEAPPSPNQDASNQQTQLK